MCQVKERDQEKEYTCIKILYDTKTMVYRTAVQTSQIYICDMDFLEIVLNKNGKNIEH